VFSLVCGWLDTVGGYVGNLVEGFGDSVAVGNSESSSRWHRRQILSLIRKEESLGCTVGESEEVG
jgi:hypothetical protein